MINKENVYDLIIIGAGPAGISAAVYAKRAMLKVIIFEGEAIGGKLNKTSIIENYAGFKKIKGCSLSVLMNKQLKSLKFEIENKKVDCVTKKDDFFIVNSKEKNFLGKTVIVATGAKERKLEIEGEKKFRNIGVSYCSVCDGFLFKNEEVIVVGGGYSGCESANYLSIFTKKVYLIHHGKELKVDEQLKDLIFSNKKIEVILNSEMKEIIGEDRIEYSKIISNLNNKERTIKAKAIFPCIGISPNSSLVKNLQICNSANYIETNSQGETKVKGLFAAGDVVRKRDRQISTAVSDGAIAAQSVIFYLKNLGKI